MEHTTDRRVSMYVDTTEKYPCGAHFSAKKERQTLSCQKTVWIWEHGVLCVHNRQTRRCGTP